MTNLTIKELRSEWVEFASTFSGRGEARKYEEMFDRCLAQRDAEVQAQALREAADWLASSVPEGVYLPLKQVDHERINVAVSAAGYTRDAVSADARRLDAALIRDVYPLERAARLTDTSEGEEK